MWRDNWHSICENTQVDEVYEGHDIVGPSRVEEYGDVLGVISEVVYSGEGERDQFHASGAQFQCGLTVYRLSRCAYDVVLGGP